MEFMTAVNVRLALCLLSPSWGLVFTGGPKFTNASLVPIRTYIEVVNTKPPSPISTPQTYNLFTNVKDQVTIQAVFKQ